MTARPRNRIGILGGTFNPIHAGHLLIAQDAMEQVGLDRVKFIPCAMPPHKEVDDFASPRHRLRMVQLAIEGDKRFEVDDIELKRGGKSYAVETLTELTRRHPKSDFYFIIGSDSLQELHLWRDVTLLLKLCTFVTAARPGFEAKHARKLEMDAGAVRDIQRHLVRGHVCDIASREIRARVAKGLSIRYLVPDSVMRYIREHRLYR